MLFTQDDLVKIGGKKFWKSFVNFAKCFREKFYKLAS
jgi:hypothetical protein